MKIDVTNTNHIYDVCHKIVTELIQIRKDTDISQQFMADWFNVSRKKISEFENGSFDFDLMVRYCEKLSVDLKMYYEIN